LALYTRGLGCYWKSELFATKKIHIIIHYKLSKRPKFPLPRENLVLLLIVPRVAHSLCYFRNYNYRRDREYRVQ